MWNRLDFLPNMRDSMENLDLLLLEFEKERVLHSDGIHLFGLKYIQSNLAAFFGETMEKRKSIMIVIMILFVLLKSDTRPIFIIVYNSFSFKIDARKLLPSPDRSIFY